jgi:hypothetical protein
MSVTKLEGPLGQQEPYIVLPTENAEQISQTALGTTEGFLVEEVVTTRRQHREAYMKYLALDKGLVHYPGGYRHLLRSHDVLKDSSTSVHQSGAGWAAIELAMMANDMEYDKRLELVEKGILCWRDAVGLYDKQANAGIPDMLNYSNAGRTELNVAMSPLLRGIISGDLSESVKRSVFMDCVRIAKTNFALGMEAGNAGNSGVKRDYAGFSMENLVMLGVNQQFEGEQLALVSSLRAGDGLYDPRKTHDLVLALPKDRTVSHATPVEVKSDIRPHHWERYKALLIGRQHLRLDQPMSYMLDALEAVGQDTADSAQWAAARLLHECVITRVDRYRTGKRTSGSKTVTRYHTPLLRAA